MRCTGKTFLGRLLVCTIAASLRLMMLHRVRLNADKLNVKITKDSLDEVMAVQRKVRAERQNLEGFFGGWGGGSAQGSS